MLCGASRRDLYDHAERTKELLGLLTRVRRKRRDLRNPPRLTASDLSDDGMMHLVIAVFGAGKPRGTHQRSASFQSSPTLILLGDGAWESV